MENISQFALVEITDSSSETFEMARRAIGRSHVIHPDQLWEVVFTDPGIHAYQEHKMKTYLVLAQFECGSPGCTSKHFLTCLFVHNLNMVLPAGILYSGRPAMVCVTYAEAIYNRKLAVEQVHQLLGMKMPSRDIPPVYNASTTNYVN